MRYFIIGALACAPALFCATPTAAVAQDHDRIIVRAEESVPAWSRRVSDNLQDRMTLRRPIGRADYPQGVAQVGFDCSSDGTPVGAAIVRSSGSAQIDAAALRAVNQLESLHPLPRGADARTHFIAMLAFANSEEERDRMMKPLVRKAEIANASVEKSLSGRQIAAGRPTILLASR